MDTSFHDCKQKHMMKSGAPPDEFKVLPHLFPMEFHGSQAELISKSSQSFFPGLISIFRDGMGPFNH